MYSGTLSKGSPRLVRDNNKLAEGIVKSDAEYSKLLAEEIITMAKAIKIDPTNIQPYSSIQTLMENLRDLNKIPSMVIQHNKLKKDNLEGTFVMRKFTTK